MKAIFSLLLSAALTFGITTSSMADEAAADFGDVLMNSSSLRLDSSSARLLRTSMTPSEVKIDMPVAMQNTVCTEYQQVPHSGQNGARCGYDNVLRRVCRDYPGQCRRDPRTGRTICSPPRRECYNQSVQIPRYCTWYETECVRTRIETSEAMREVTLKFKKMVRLSTGETESFDIEGRQRRLDGTEAVYNFSAVSTKRPVSINIKDGPLTGFKDIITIKGE